MTRSSRPAPIRNAARAPIARPKKAPPATIIAVASGKGGVGKTWFSITLSMAFAARGERVLLVDGDLGLANVDVQLGITPESDLGAVIEGWVELEDAVCAVHGGAGRGGIDVLPGRSGTGQLANLPPDQVARFAAGLAVLSLHYDKLILDLAAGADEGVMRLARSADMQIIVLNDEPPSMTDAYAFIKLLNAANPNLEPFVVVNMADGRQAGRRTYDTVARACETFLKFRPPFGGVVSRDQKVRDAIRTQTPLPMLDKNAPAAKDVLEIAANLAQSIAARE